MASLRLRNLWIARAALSLLVLAGCAGQAELPVAGPEGAGNHTLIEREDWRVHFEEHGVVGTFVLHEVGSDQIEVFDQARAAELLTPASTFKILNSMIILETAVVDDVDAVVPWDGVDRGSTGWNRDQTLRSAIRTSAVWAYQELARGVGEDRMQEWVSAARYGNEDTGGSIDSFWLSGDLRISALQQVDFLTRFVERDLPFSPETHEAVREILVRESGPDWSWSHKTGLSSQAEPDLGWLVGIVDVEATSWVFALNIDLEAGGEPIEPVVREELARQILETETRLVSS